MDEAVIYGSDELLEYVVDLVLVPRLCELCYAHPAVYYECAWWPSTYMCRPCLEAGESDRRRELYFAAVGRSLSQVV